MGKISLRISSSAIALAIGIAICATPAASQSLTDRFKSLFGGKSDEPAQQPPIVDPNQDQQPDLNCPPVTIRSGASTYAVAAPGKQPIGNDVRFQATITKTARECIKNGGDITAHIGIQGRVIVGPSGAPPTVEIPMRIAVVQGGVSEKVIATKAYRTTVELGEQDSVPFSLVANDLVYPVPPGATGDNYVFYIGFDPQALAPEPKPRAVKRKR
ncbi:hypothetical protein [Bradyrhizobium sp. ARR65]|uniref:hypothetical protein n=1 Tax=Bradyrhizobium sp. ARR65 TaxID=1040989 RepID=UPI000464C64E|nr:hypothetical protein [Bradyrhizobium sp. ARR65]